MDGFADKVTREIEESGNERLELSGVESTSGASRALGSISRRWRGVSRGEGGRGGGGIHGIIRM